MKEKWTKLNDERYEELSWKKQRTNNETEELRTLIKKGQRIGIISNSGCSPEYEIKSKILEFPVVKY